MQRLILLLALCSCEQYNKDRDQEERIMNEQSANYVSEARACKDMCLPRNVHSLTYDSWSSRPICLCEGGSFDGGLR